MQATSKSRVSSLLELVGHLDTSKRGQEGGAFSPNGSQEDSSQFQNTYLLEAKPITGQHITL